MKYYVYLQQQGQGCDYTIGCGEHLTSVNADNDEEAVEKLSSLIKDNYTSDEFYLERAILFKDTIPFDLQSLYEEIESEKEKEKKKLQHLRDMKDFERLRKKLSLDD